MSDFEPVPNEHLPPPVLEPEVDHVPDPGPVVEETPPAIEVDAAPSSTEPPPVEAPAEVPADLPPSVARVSAEGVVLSKCEFSPEGVLLRVLEE